MTVSCPGIADLICEYLYYNVSIISRAIVVSFASGSLASRAATGRLLPPGDGQRHPVNQSPGSVETDRSAGASPAACPAPTAGSVMTTAGFFGFGGSDCRTAHWGWMPAREYTSSWQTGQRTLVETGLGGE